MKTDLFHSKIEKYYGKHENDEVVKITEMYIEKAYKQDSLGKLLSAIYRSHPSSWGFPDVSAIEKAHEKFMKSDDLNLKAKKEVKEYKMDVLSDEDLIKLNEHPEWQKMKEMLGRDK